MNIEVTKRIYTDWEERIRTLETFFWEDESLGDMLFIRVGNHNYFLLCKREMVEILDTQIRKEDAMHPLDNKKTTIKDLKNWELRACEGKEGRYIQHERGKGVKNVDTLSIEDEEMVDKIGFSCGVRYNKIVGFVPYYLFQQKKITKLNIVHKEQRMDFGANDPI